MKTDTHTLYLEQHDKRTHLPNSARGRALFTIDWFLNGSPLLRDHDNQRATVFRQPAIQHQRSKQ